MKKMNKHGWGLDDMIGFIIAFVAFLIVIAILIYSFRQSPFLLLQDMNRAIRIFIGGIFLD